VNIPRIGVTVAPPTVNVTSAQNLKNMSGVRLSAEQLRRPLHTVQRTSLA